MRKTGNPGATSGSTEETARRAHDLVASGRMPPPVYAKRCDSCSLVGCRMPAEDDPEAAFGEELSDTDSKGRIRWGDGDKHSCFQR